MIHFDLPAKQKQYDDYQVLMNDQDFWNDPKHAQHIIKLANGLKDIVSKSEQLQLQNASLIELVDSYDGTDSEMWELIEEEFSSFKKAFANYELDVLLADNYNKNNAIVSFHPGAGGTESQDWAQMLERMIERYAAVKGYKCTILDWQDGEEAGIKSASVLVEGYMAYGYLKALKGVHRLVRISPFDSNARRHTSFASMDVMPQFDDDIELTIDENDLQIDTHRASGAGGQHINKTDSAVRILHKPTGIVVNCQSERSQIQNRERAMNMLRSKLYQVMLEQQAQQVASLKGDVKSIEWGSQIMSYVFCPYTMVKDLRTNYEQTNVEKVMDGDLDGFIFAYLKSLIGE